MYAWQGFETSGSSSDGVVLVGVVRWRYFATCDSAKDIPPSPTHTCLVFILKEMVRGLVQAVYACSL